MFEQSKYKVYGMKQFLNFCFLPPGDSKDLQDDTSWHQFNNTILYVAYSTV